MPANPADLSHATLPVPPRPTPAEELDQAEREIDEYVAECLEYIARQPLWLRDIVTERGKDVSNAMAAERQRRQDLKEWSVELSEVMGKVGPSHAVMQERRYGPRPELNRGIA